MKERIETIIWLAEEQFKDNEVATIKVLPDTIQAIKNLVKENKELREENHLQRSRLNSKIEELINELDEEYKKSQEMFNKLYEIEETDMQDYYDMREALAIMQTTSHLQRKLGELLGG